MSKRDINLLNKEKQYTFKPDICIFILLYIIAFSTVETFL